ncbi:MFS transporter [Glaciimonas sp. PAMC28666]|uniref:MFS transporter n=1 Tax=Glaciimonas sp. PAMC28666 TaxID=2807626 RepID=UPI0019661E04|nr:MFS transporter [Glaciimonas sp. PAMC28666]QRX82470.1 MFS transporter [Glaciimonas sp. PAMC28666]
MNQSISALSERESHATVAPANVVQRTRPTHVRFFMLALVLLATIINYLDRTNLSVVAPFMSKELGIDKFHMGLLFSAFAWTYAIALIPGGVVVDKFGSRVVYGVSLILWSIATFMQGSARSFASLLGLRLVIGTCEAPAFPANARAVTMWFPQNERGMATGIYVMGQYLGTALFSALLLWMTTVFGWHAVFYVSGAVGVVFGLIWFALYRDPAQSKLVNEEELRLISDGGGLATSADAVKFKWSHALQLLRYRQIWALCIGKFASSSALYFFLTWFPTYLLEDRHITILKTGFFSILPFVGATIGILLGGWGADKLIRRGASVSFARKFPLIAGSLLGSTIVLANFTDSDALCIAILTGAFFAQGLSATSWAAMSEVAPKGLIGVTAGLTSVGANLAGIVTPIVIGYIVRETGSFAWGLGFISILSLIGTCSYAFLMGPVSRIVLDHPAKAG